MKNIIGASAFLISLVLLYLAETETNVIRIGFMGLYVLIMWVVMATKKD